VIVEGRSVVGFPKVLVHDYADIDRERVVEALSRLDDLDAFAADVEGWLSRREAGA